jgi:hypothetical protein
LYIWYLGKLLSVIEPPRLGLQIDLDLFPALLIISLIVISRLTRDHLRAFDSCHRCWMDNNALYFPSTHSNTRMCKTFRKLAKGFLHGAPKVHQRCLLLRELRSGLLPHWAAVIYEGREHSSTTICAASVWFTRSDLRHANLLFHCLLCLWWALHHATEYNQPSESRRSAH